ncbi:hypothetical protein BCR42DRAFT_382511 [Absidia repens]|uniref:Uncharacterized protein n=1 Tax=Absidia repens TaxID=90262 RepID=A0A1X2I3S2_9FUNG|nr:hypothetical protein BCR42DRAFT_382511 [Absidia repens]
MTFEQLSIVRQDGIVDEGIVFKALWQREALERLLFPFNYQQSQQAVDFNGLEDHEMDRQVLLGAPQFRFSASVCLTLPNEDDHAGWDVAENMDTASTTTSARAMARTSSEQSQQASGNIYNKTVYTEAKYILGHWHRVRVEAQVLPRSLLQIQDDDEGDRDERKQDGDNNHQEPVQQQSKIRYAIYCLNQHDGLVKNDQVDPEDRVLVPISEVIESSDSIEQCTGYVGQILLNTDVLENKNVITVDMMVALEIFGFTNKYS